ncbi:hypothetical protein BGX38DRAFT_1273677 [Terfezia claveryi]|nr:hypothetical protein BGX38DRAFT_1273677 [Terfezia claveryi]
MDSQSISIPPHQTPAQPSPTSVPMTPQASNTTVVGVEVMTPVSSSAHSEMGESDTERASPTLPNSPSPQPTLKSQSLIPIKPEKEVQTLIDLPVDVLKEVNNTNDLVSLSLTCRCLHALSTPHIYSRFDIVWPDSNTVGDRSGVDALTYGLATLVASGPRGNNYGRWIRKFSLGNGPAEWVGEYNIAKEGGKMLGTLVNLAIMRMQNLETFNWDMPTGVLRDIFMSLHDLCPQSLKNMHVRFHDNSETTAPLSQDPTRRVETPTFKGFKALKQLSVLDIDERQYLEEMAWAIEESVDTLRELRVGLAEHVIKSGTWILDLDEGPGDVADAAVGGASGSAVGGMMGILVSRICQLTEQRRKLKAGVAAGMAPGLSTAGVNALLIPIEAEMSASGNGQPSVAIQLNQAAQAHGPHIFDVASIAAALPGPFPNGIAEALTMGNDSAISLPVPWPADLGALEIFDSAGPSTATNTSTNTEINTSINAATKTTKESKIQIKEEEKPFKQLKLDTLDLERVPLSVRVLQKVIDWAILTNLTILNCPNHEKLWKILRRKFSPYSSQYSVSTNSSNAGVTRPGVRRQVTHPIQVPEYKIRLKKLHTDLVSPSLIAFINETLPPNTLEVLFLQENPQTSNTPTGYSSPVTTDQILKCCIKRHRLSLRKFLLDANVGTQGVWETDKWKFNREVLSFITIPGKMPRLRELGFSIDYKDWHFFLTRLPGLAGLRSLYLPSVKGAVQMPQLVCKEMALQVVDVVSLRNEVEICYVGIMKKCFELLEGRDADVDGVGDGIGMAELGDEEEDEDGGSDEDEDEDEDLINLQGEGEDEDEEVMDEDELEEEGGAGGHAWGGTGVKDEDGGDDVVERGGSRPERDVKVQLREILFYDDKVSVFKARGGSL